MWWRRQSVTRRWPGSETSGIPASLTSAIFALALPVWLWLGGAPGPGIYLANLGLAIVSALFFPTSAALIRESAYVQHGISGTPSISCTFAPHSDLRC